MKKTLRTLILGATALSVLCLHGAEASAVSLKNTSVVKDGTLKLGDIFDNLPENGDKVLGAAPMPGQEMVLNARTLLRIAVALDLPWRPASGAESITLTRAATVIGQDPIEDALKTALEGEGVSGKYRLDFAGEKVEMILPDGEKSSVEIASLEINADRDGFTATLAAPSRAKPLQKLSLSGKIERMIDVPVVREALNAGTVIGQRDIDFIEVPEKTIENGIALKAEELIGMTPKRLLTQGKPIKANDLESPRIVARGEAVTMIFKEGGLTLTTRGKALEHGAKGDLIRVVNTASNKTVEAYVTASNEVTIQSY